MPQTMSNYSIAKGLNPDSTIVSSPDQVSCDLGGEAAILNLKTGVYSGLDPVGARIWALLSKPTTLGGLSEAISTEYDITPERCEADIRELLIQLENAGLVLVNAPGAPGKEHLSVRQTQPSFAPERVWRTATRLCPASRLRDTSAQA